MVECCKLGMKPLSIELRSNFESFNKFIDGERNTKCKNVQNKCTGLVKAQIGNTLLATGRRVCA